MNKLRKVTLFKLLTILLTTVIGILLLETLSGLYLHSQREESMALRIFDRSDSGGVTKIGIKKNFSQVWQQRDFSVDVVTNNIGLRENADYHNEHIDIGFLGDSFTFGHGVNVSDRYSDLLRGYFPDLNILTFSYLNGWTTPHYYFFLQKNPHLSPDIAILGLFLGNDLTCDIEETELIFDDDQELISVNAITQEIHPKGFFVTIDHNPITNSFRKSNFGELLLRKKLLQKLGIVPDLAQGANVYPPIEFDHGELNGTNKVGLEFILKLHKFQTDQNKRLVVFLIPYNFYVGEYGSYVSPEAAQDIRENQYLPKTIMRWCQTNGVECANPIPYLKKLEREGTRLYFRYDDHWNEAGHAAAAEVLYDYLSETYEELN